MKKLHRLVFLVLGTMMTLVVMFHSAQADTVMRGEAQSIGYGTARTYTILGNRGRVSEVGIVLSESALSGLPTEATEINLSLPRQALSATPFTHVGLNWNPNGHAPAPIYGVAHFDMHFYTIPQAVRDRITATGEDAARAYKTPNPDLIPAGYVMAPDSAEPRQGSHWINPQSPEFQGTPHGFDHTFIYGFYNGSMDFLEPMISKAALEQHQSFDEAIARPSRYSPPGAYPSRYRMSYDAQAHEFRISLSSLTR